jgi:hypothetical protein
MCPLGTCVCPNNLFVTSYLGQLDTPLRMVTRDHAVAIWQALPAARFIHAAGEVGASHKK